MLGDSIFILKYSQKNDAPLKKFSEQTHEIEQHNYGKIWYKFKAVKFYKCKNYQRAGMLGWVRRGVKIEQRNTVLFALEIKCRARLVYIYHVNVRDTPPLYPILLSPFVVPKVII